MIKACIFDAYGTLFNVHLPSDQLQDEAGEKADTLLNLWRQKQLEYSWLRANMRTYVPFEQVTEEALTYAFSVVGISSPSLFKALMGIYWTPTPFPEVKSVLTTLKRKGIKTAILSNGSPALLAAGVKHAELSSVLDDYISVDAVQTFKPQPAVYQLALDRLRLTAEEVTFQSSNAWDIAGATTFGLPTVWINRKEQPFEQLGVQPHIEGKTLTDLLAYLDTLS